jgi:membrane-bound inhibitor of C-type lysozyme
MIHPSTHRLAILALAAAGLTVSACAGDTADQEESEMPAEQASTEAAAAMQAPHGNVSVLLYECAEGGFMLTIAEGVNKAALRIDETVYQLDQQESETGMSFSDGSYTFRGEGDTAQVEKDGETVFSDCRATGHPM